LTLSLRCACTWQEHLTRYLKVPLAQYRVVDIRVAELSKPQPTDSQLIEVQLAADGYSALVRQFGRVDERIQFRGVDV